MDSIKMSSAPSLIALGNAIVDVCYFVSDEQLQATKIAKGSMTLLSRDQMVQLIIEFGEPHSIAAGGSAANTIIGYAALGGNAGYIGAISNDTYGLIFQDKLKQTVTPRLDIVAVTKDSTAICVLFITPDGERTMGTYLGVCSQLTMPLDVDIWLTQARMVLLEGYLCGSDTAYDAIYRAALLSKQFGHQVTMSLASVSCVEMNFERMQKLLHEFVDVVVGTVDEAMALTKTDTIEGVIEALKHACCVGALTDGAKGAYVFNEHETVFAPAPLVLKVLDTTGAGDQFAAGYLYGLLHDLDLMQTGELASYCAGRTVERVGAHPNDPYQHPLLNHKVSL